MQFIYAKDFNDNKKGDKFKNKNGFWIKYYSNKGIIKPQQELETQDKPKTKKSRPAKRKFNNE